jgi:hypothetical protein
MLARCGRTPFKKIAHSLFFRRCGCGADFLPADEINVSNSNQGCAAQTTKRR